MEYASKGVGGAGLGLGIAGTALGLLNANGGGVLGGLMGGGDYVSRETFDLSQQLARSQMDNAVLSADLASEKKMVEVFNASVERTNKVRDELMGMVNELDRKVDSGFSAQAVINCQTGSAVNLLQNQMAQLYGMTKMVIPNTSVCPGWGNAEVTIATTPATT